jgi:hypothetical protein
MRGLLAFLSLFVGCNCSGASAPVSSTGSVHVADAVTEPETSTEATDSVDAQDALNDSVQAPVPATESVKAAPAEVKSAPAPVDKMAICLAAADALNPDWRLDACDNMSDDPADGQRISRCRAQRAPLRKFANDICKTVVEESERFGFDVLLPLAVMERESSMGRVYFDDDSHTYHVNTNVCELPLAANRIVSRQPGPKPGTDLMMWTYGDDHAVNRQVVRVVSEDGTGGVTVNTCVAGEEGTFQSTAREFRSGLVVQATGQRLTGDAAHRREEVRSDPVLQVQLGCQALAEHRDICPENLRSNQWDWISVYNIGRCDPTSQHGHDYTLKVIGHYRDACAHGYIKDAAGIQRPIEYFWPGCADAEAARARLIGEDPQ